MAVTPIFIYSLPRSGSTLLQRLLAAHERIDTASEPWILLPLLYTTRREGVFAEYSHARLVRAHRSLFEDVDLELRHRAVRQYATEIYEGLGAGDFFIDKTPRYHLIATDLVRCFPEARHMILWRNPISVAASIIETWGDGKWNLPRYAIDLYAGLEALLECQAEHEDRVRTVRYEDLIHDTGSVMQEVARHVGVQIDEGIMERGTRSTITGEMGDPEGQFAYDWISEEPLTKWRETIDNPVRVRLIRRYIEWIGDRRLTAMGYDRDDLLERLDSVDTHLRGSLGDLLRVAGGWMSVVADGFVVRSRLRNLITRSRPYKHT